MIAKMTSEAEIQVKYQSTKDPSVAAAARLRFFYDFLIRGSSMNAEIEDDFNVQTFDHIADGVGIRRDE